MAKTGYLNNEQNIDSIINASLVAHSKANMMILSGQTTFLLNNCFKLKDKIYEPVMITMSIQMGGAEGKFITFQIPLINLLSINALSVAKAHINFSIDITTPDKCPTNEPIDILSEKALYRRRLNGTDRNGKTPSMKGLEVSVKNSSQPLSRGLLTVMELYEKVTRASVPLKKRIQN